MMMRQAAGTHYKPTADVLVQELAGISVLLDLKSEQYFQLNSTGSRIWAGLASGQTPEAIAVAVAADTSAPVDQVQADVNRLVGELLDTGLIAPDAA